MNATLLAILVGIFVLGVLLVVWGRRGRKLNNHPQCRGCWFDLDGVYPASPTCPECGAGLKRDGAVRNGVRKRMGWMVALGVLVALLPLAPMGVLLYAGVTGSNIAKYTPTGVLLWQTRFSSPPVNKAIADELIDRMLKQKLDKSQLAAVAERMLEIQGDRSAEWNEAWGDVIERLNLSGDLSKEQAARFYQQAARLSGKARKAVRPGDMLPIVVTADAGRIGSASQLLTMGRIETAKLGDEVLKKPSGRTTNLFGIGNSAGGAELYFYMFGSKSNAGWSSAVGQEQGQTVALTVPKNIKPGPATLTVTILGRSGDYRMGWNNNRIKADDPDVSTFTITQQIDVLPADADPIKQIPPTKQSEKALRALLEQMTVTANVTASNSLFPLFGAGLSVNRMISAQLNIDKPPVPFAFDVFVRLRDKETRIGTIASSPAATSSGYGYGYGGGKLQYMNAAVPNLLRTDRTVDLIFRPNTKIALGTADMSEIYGGEITFKDFAVAGNGTAVTTTTSTTTEDIEKDKEKAKDKEEKPEGENKANSKP